MACKFLYYHTPIELHIEIIFFFAGAFNDVILEVLIHSLVDWNMFKLCAIVELNGLTTLQIVWLRPICLEQ